MRRDWHIEIRRILNTTPFPLRGRPFNRLTTNDQDMRRQAIVTLGTVCIIWGFAVMSGT